MNKTYYCNRSEKELTIEEVLIQYDPLIIKFSKLYNIEGYDTEDIAQELRLHIFRFIDKYDKDKSSLISYLHWIIKSRLANLITTVNYKKRKGGKIYNLNEIASHQKKSADITWLDRIEDRDDTFDKRINHIYIKQILNNIDKELHRNIIIDYYFNNITQSDIGIKYNISQARVYQIINYIINKFKENTNI